MMPKSALENIIYDNNPEFKKRLNLDQIEEEIRRYNPEYRDGLNLIVIRRKEQGRLKEVIDMLELASDTIEEAGETIRILGIKYR